MASLFNLLKSQFAAPSKRRRQAVRTTSAELCEQRSLLSAGAVALVAPHTNVAPRDNTPQYAVSAQSANAATAASPVVTATGVNRAAQVTTPARLVTSPRDVEPNSTPGLADHFGTFGPGTHSGTLYGHVGRSGDTLDYSSFTVTSSATVQISLGSLQQDLDLQLEDSAGYVIAYSVRSGTQTDSVSATLNAGTYYIKTFKGVSSAVSSYSLRLDLNVGGDPDRNYSRDTAQNLGTFGYGVNFPRVSSSVAGSGDTQDFYRFTVTRRTSANIYLGGLRQDLDLQLQDSNGNVLSSSINGGMANDTVSRVLNPGVYYIRVHQGVSGAVSAYRLDLQLSGY